MSPEVYDKVTLGYSVFSLGTLVSYTVNRWIPKRVGLVAL